MFLSDKQVEALTRRKQPAAQVRVLREAGIEYRRGFQRFPCLWIFAGIFVFRPHSTRGGEFGLDRFMASSAGSAATVAGYLSVPALFASAGISQPASPPIMAARRCPSLPRLNGLRMRSGAPGSGLPVTTGRSHQYYRQAGSDVLHFQFIR